jgi:hypothetical protein
MGTASPGDAASATASSGAAPSATASSSAGPEGATLAGVAPWAGLPRRRFDASPAAMRPYFSTKARSTT